MFDYFYYGLPFFFKPIFSLILIICLGIITPYIIILADKDKDYKNKKIFIIYEKAISILLILHIVLILINSIRIINFISNLIIGAVGIAIIYGIFYILEKNNIFITKPNIKKYLKFEKISVIGKIFIYICVFILSILGGMGLWEFIKRIFINFIEFTSPFFILYFEKTGINVESFWENISNPEYMLILLIIAFVLVCIILLLFFIFILLFLIFIISVSNNYILDKFYNEKIRKKVKNNKDNFISKIFKKWKKDKSGDNYTI